MNRALEAAPSRGALLYFGAALLSQASGLLRYVALARLLGPAQLGLAAALTVTGSFFEFVSDTGSDRFLIQDRDGDLPAVQRLVQLVYVSRGTVVALLLAGFALPIARIYGTPTLAAGIAWLALSPAIAGLLHLDIRRLQRQHDFRPEAICTAAADTAGLLAAIAAAWWLRSFVAVACGFVVRSAVLVAASHQIARRPYRLGWDREHAPRLARFAAPLMLNGLALFLVSQGDRVLVANRLGVTALGYYAAILLLILYPSNVIANYLHTLFVPRIAALRDTPAERNRLADRFGGLTLLLAVLMACGFVLVAPPAVPLLFGRRFAQSATLIGLIGLLQATRFLLSWPTTVALAMGRTTTVLVANLCHIAIVPGALLGLVLIGGLPGIVAGFLLTEIGAAAVAVRLLNRATGEPWTRGMPRLGLLLLAAVPILGWGEAIDGAHWLRAAAMLAAMAALLAWMVRREAASIETELAVPRHAAVTWLRANWPRFRAAGGN